MTGSNNGKIPQRRQRVVSPEVQRRINEDKEKTAKVPHVNPKAEFARFFTGKELKDMSDNDLVKVMMNTPHQRIHLDALSQAKARPSLAENELVKRKVKESQVADEKRKVERQERERLAAEAAKERARELGWPGYMDKRWFSVSIGSWTGQFFTNRADVLGQAYRRFAQESGQTALPDSATVRELGGFTLPN